MDDDAPLPGADWDGLRAALLDIAERVRHPNLGLGYFVAEVPDDSKGDFDPDDSDGRSQAIEAIQAGGISAS